MKYPDIPFSFCIITDSSAEAIVRIHQIVDSIEFLKIPEYEILIIGGTGNKINRKIKKIDFDETTKKTWLTKKKNDIIKHCNYENVVMFHDYFVFHPSWYENYKKFFNQHDYDICCNPILQETGVRDYTDWVTWDDPIYGRHGSLPYHDWSRTKNQYINGGYFIVKKNFLINNPFNESLVAHQEEDVEWSLRVREKARIICNPTSYCKHNKNHRNQTINIWDKLI